MAYNATIDARLAERRATDRRKASERALLLCGVERRAHARRLAMRRACDNARVANWLERYTAARLAAIASGRARV